MKFDSSANTLKNIINFNNMQRLHESISRNIFFQGVSVSVYATVCVCLPVQCARLDTFHCKLSPTHYSVYQCVSVDICTSRFVFFLCPCADALNFFLFFLFLQTLESIFKMCKSETMRDEWTALQNAKHITYI